MKILKFLLFIVLASSIQYLAARVDDKIQRQVLVQVKPENSYKVYLEKLFPAASIELTASDFQIWRIEFPAIPPMDYISQLKREGKINLYMRNRRIEPRATTPNDSFFSQQTFHLNNFNPGQSVTYGINSIGAWDYNKSGVTAKGDTIVVAVCEDGFDSLHQDLDYFINYQENPNDTIDNDGNGAKNDYRGWDIANNDYSLKGGGISHSTRVCGAFARGNNSKGISGVAWNCKILPINFNGVVSIDNSIKAYNYCLNMKRLYRQTNKQKGAYIVAINFSFGTTGDPAEDTLWKAAIDSLGKEGILMSIAVDNKDSDVESYQDLPVLLNSPYQINVTNYNYTSLQTDGSAFSKKYVHIAAPNKYHTTMANNSYGNSGFGASFSAPIVASTIALMYSNMCDKFLDSLHTRPEFYTKIIKDIILANVDVTPGLTNKVVSNGKLNVFKTIQKIDQLKDSFCKKDSIYTSITSRTKEYIQVYHSAKFIYIKKTNNLPLSLSLHNMLGQRVMDYRVDQIEEKIDVQHLPSGFYILNYSYDQQYFTEKIVLD
ncbi:MAG: S8 family peptidase [Chitinophagales bacterium]|nr:S8 family peptidase [Chitinophagales bacterium]